MTKMTMKKDTRSRRFEIKIEEDLGDESLVGKQSVPTRDGAIEFQILDGDQSVAQSPLAVLFVLGEEHDVERHVPRGQHADCLSVSLKQRIDRDQQRSREMKGSQVVFDVPDEVAPLL